MVPSQELAGRHHLVHDEPRMIGGKLQAHLFLHHVHDEVEHVVAQRKALARALSLEDGPVVLQVRRAHLDLVGKAAQERGIHKVFRLQVCGEDHQFLKRNTDGLAGVQLEIVNAALQRNNPAIEQIGGAHQLPAEVVD